MELPDCLDCKYSDAGHPCRLPDGRFDFPKVGAAIVAYGRTFAVDGENLDEDARATHAWASDCGYEVEQDYPHLLLPLIVAAMDACETPGDAAYVAAGPLENAVVKHGPVLIGQIEALAAQSAKFRYFLSAIWGQSHTDPEVWARVCKAVGSHGRMDTDGRGPWDGSPITVLNEEQATELLKERVGPAAIRVGL
jgi:hypothetical protein